MKILGIAGSLRPGSFNARLLRAALGMAPDGVEVVELEGLADVPPFDLDREAEGGPHPAAAVAFQDAIAGADAVLFATPEYNGSVPGQLKNALDWASVPFPDNVLKNKSVAVMGTSTGMFGAVWAQAELRKVLGLSGARVLDREAPVPLAEKTAEQSKTADGKVDPTLAAQNAANQVSAKIPEEDKEKAKQKAKEKRAELNEKTKNYYNEKMPQERRDRTIWRLKKMVVEIQGHQDCK